VRLRLSLPQIRQVGGQAETRWSRSPTPTGNYRPSRSLRQRLGDGAISTDGTSWHSSGRCAPAAGHGQRDGARKTRASGDPHSVQDDARSDVQRSTLLGNQTYGVAWPITISFDQPVAAGNRRCGEGGRESRVQARCGRLVLGRQSRRSTSGQGSTGPQHTQVASTRLNGVEIAPGMYGTADLSQSSRSGKSYSAA